MAKPWTQVVASEEYQSFTPAQQAYARRRYFDQVIAPNIPESKLQRGRARFEETAGKAETLAYAASGGLDVGTPRKSSAPVPLRPDLLDEVDDSEISVDPAGNRAVNKNGQSIPLDRGFDESADAPLYLARPARGAPAGETPGLKEAGNIDLDNRPKVKNEDGSVSTLRTMSVGIAGEELLLPTISEDGRALSDEEAIAEYERSGKHLGIFDSPEAATGYAKTLSRQQAARYGAGEALPNPSRDIRRAAFGQPQEDPEVMAGDGEANLLGVAGRTIKQAAQGTKYLGEQAAATPGPMTAGLADFPANLALAAIPGSDPNTIFALGMEAALTKPGLTIGERLSRAGSAVLDIFKAEPVSRAARQVAPGAMAYVNKGAQQYADETRSLLRQTSEKQSRDLEELGFSGEVASAVAQMAPAAVLMFATKSPKLAASTIAGPVAAQSLSEGLDRGQTIGQAAQRAAAMTAAEFLTESPALGVIFAPIKALQKTGGLGEAIKIFGKRLASSAGAEYGQEYITSLVQNAYDAGVLDDQKSIGQILQEAGHDAALGAIVGGVYGLPGATAEARAGYRDRHAQAKDALRAAGVNNNASDLVAREAAQRAGDAPLTPELIVQAVDEVPDADLQLSSARYKKLRELVSEQQAKTLMRDELASAVQLQIGGEERAGTSPARSGDSTNPNPRGQTGRGLAPGVSDAVPGLKPRSDAAPPPAPPGNVIAAPESEADIAAAFERFKDDDRNEGSTETVASRAGSAGADRTGSGGDRADDGLGLQTALQPGAVAEAATPGLGKAAVVRGEASEQPVSLSDRDIRLTASSATASLERNEKLDLADFAESHAGLTVNEVQRALAAFHLGAKIATNDLKNLSMAISARGEIAADQIRRNAAGQPTHVDLEVRRQNQLMFQRERVRLAEQAVSAARDKDRYGLSVDDGPNKQKAVKRLQHAREKLAELESDGLNLRAHEAAPSPQNDLPEPSEAQKLAGNYQKGHVRLQGLDISIENPKGSTRSGTDGSGKAWSVEMQDHYGYIRGTKGKDKDHIDVFIGPRPETATAYVVDQIDPSSGQFDEHKVLLGYSDIHAARQGYQRNYAAGWKGLGNITAAPVAELKQWLKQPRRAPYQRLPKTTALDDARLASPESRRDLEAMAPEAGWDEVGGRLMRSPEYEGDPNPPVTGRTPWVPGAPWFAAVQRDAGLPGNLRGQATRAAVRKALAGERMSEPEKRHIQAMMDWAAAERQDYEVQGATGIDPFDLAGVAAEHDVSSLSLGEEALAARAREIDEDAFERAAVQFGDDDRGFMQAIRSIVHGRRTETSDGQGADRAVDAGGAGVPRAQAEAEGAGQSAVPGQAQGQMGGEVSELRDSSSLSRAPGSTESVSEQANRRSGGGARREADAVAAPAPVVGSVEGVGDDSSAREVDRGGDVAAAVSAGRGMQSGERALREARSDLDRRDAESVDPRAVPAIQLSAQTEKDLAERAERHRASRTAEEKQARDAEAKDFRLTGSERAADVAIAGTPGVAVPANTIFTEDAAAAARERLRKKFKAPGSTPGTGIDPELLQDGITLAGYHIERGARTFAAYSKTMIEDLGEAIRPYLKSLYNAVRDFPGFDPTGMDSYESVARTDRLPPEAPILRIEPFGTNNRLIIVRGDTKPNKDRIKAIKGAMWDRDAGGWTFLAKLEPRVREALGDLLGTSNQTPTAASAGDTLTSEDANAQRSRQRVEPDRRDADAAQPVREALVSSRSEPDDGGARARGQRTGARGERSGGRTGVSGDGAAAGRVSSDPGVRGRESGARGSTAGDPERQPGADPGGEGTRLDPTPDRAVTAAARSPVSFAEKLRLQQAAESVPVKLGNRINIADTLPLLLQGQQDDVEFAERRYAAGKEPGVLFTNGTGTGKTYSGLGIVKRFARRGRDSILIVVPNEKIASDWIKSGANLGLEIQKLADTKGNGNSGPVITTYANFGDNPTLADREWDLIVPDEAHYLGSNKAGDVTRAGEVLRALTRHDRGKSTRSLMKHRELHDQVKDLSDRIAGNNRILNGPDTMDQVRNARTKENEDLNKQLTIMLGRIKSAEAADADAAPADSAKALFLSASPFAYDKSIDWADGYLFNYPKASDSGRSSYNTPQGRERFMAERFGYRMRYNKLTEPGPEVDRGLLEVEFNKWLRDSGALSTRQLDSEYDYDREFILIDDAVGHRVDEGFDWLRNSHQGAFQPLYSMLNEIFDYHARMYLLESIKAKHAVSIVKDYVKRGRKVVVFHGFNKGGSQHPFDFSSLAASDRMLEIPLRKGVAADGAPAQAGVDKALLQRFHGSIAAPQSAYEDGTLKISLKNLVRMFDHVRPDLKQLDLGGLMSPIARFKQDVPESQLFNGTIPARQRMKSMEWFNDDATGPAVLVVQSDAGREGISMHDTSGAHRRVIVNLGLPVRPVAAIQEEGRIYRVGQASDAVMRYLNTGTSWERTAFAQKIASRAGTVENMAMGSEARALKESFIEAFEDSAPFTSRDDDGRGGKARDRATRRALTGFERAKTYYFAQQKKTARSKAAEGVDYFATPEPLAYKMVEWAGIRAGESVLEPSAGHGAIARFFPESAKRRIIEPSGELASRAALVSGGADLVASTFEQHNIVNKYDAIVMNPPFGYGGKTAMDHLSKAIDHLREHGRIVALLPDGPAANQRLEKLLDNLPYINVVADIGLPTVTFERAGTGVKTHVVVMDRIVTKARWDEVGKRWLEAGTPRPKASIDLSGRKTIAELFEGLEDREVAPRIGAQPRASQERPRFQAATRADIAQRIDAQAQYLRGVKAMDQAVRSQADVGNAMVRPEIGDIDFIWGDNPGTAARGYEDGGGIHHVIMARQSAGLSEQQAKNFLARIVEAIAFGTFDPGSLAATRTRAIIEHDGNRVILARKLGAMPRNWVLTGYEKSSGETGKESDYTRSMQPLPIPGRQGLGAELFERLPSGTPWVNADGATPYQASARMRDDLVAAPLTPAAARAIAVTELSERGIGNLERAGILRFVRDVNALPSRELQDYVDAKDAETPGARVVAVIDHATARVFILSDRVRAADIVPLILHEVGEHFGMPRMMGEASYRRLLQSLREMKDSAVVADAWAETARLYPELDPAGDKFASELLARLAESAEFRKQSLWRRIITAIRSFLFKLGLTSAIREQDLAPLVVAALRRAMRDGAYNVARRDDLVMAATGRDDGVVFPHGTNVYRLPAHLRALRDDIPAAMRDPQSVAALRRQLRQAEAAVNDRHGIAENVQQTRRAFLELDDNGNILIAGLPRNAVAAAEAVTAAEQIAGAHGLGVAILPSADGAMSRPGYQSYGLSQAAYVRAAGGASFPNVPVLMRNFKGPPLYAVRPTPVYFSQLGEVLAEKLPNKGGAKVFRSMVEAWQRKGEFKKEELQWSGLLEWLDTQPNTLTKAEVVQFLRDNAVELQEVTKGGSTDHISQDLLTYISPDIPESAAGWLKVASELERQAQREQRRGDAQAAEISFTRSEEAGRLAETFETDLGHAVGATKFASYQIPGGENYRELLLTLVVGGKFHVDERPTAGGGKWFYVVNDAGQDVYATGSRKDAESVALQGGPAQFKSPHFDEPNVLVHVRFSVRTDSKGRRVLFIEEVQSDWHQKGRKQGYAKPEISREESGRRQEKIFARFDAGEITMEQRNHELDELGAVRKRSFSGVPDAPFKTTWPMLAMKRMIRYGAENGFDSVAWTTGEMQAERYDLSKQVRSIDWSGSRGGDKIVTISPLNGNDIEFRVMANGTTTSISGGLSGNEFTGKRLDEVVGKEASDKIMADRDGSLSGDGLRVGGEGMRAFYDRELVNEVNRYVKKWGGKVIKTEIQTDPLASNFADTMLRRNSRGTSAAPETAAVHAVDITPEMRAAALRPQPMFAVRRVYGMPKAAGDPIATFRNSSDLKAHADYVAAKAGDAEAAARLVSDLVAPAQLEDARKRFGSGAVFVPATARESTGDNLIPGALARLYAEATGGTVETDVVQANRAFHTGADQMERLISRPLFTGSVRAGARYVVVDDVSTMGATLAEMADHIQDKGGTVVGSVLLANASRSGRLAPEKSTVTLIERRLGDEIRNQFDVEPTALTHDEAGYLVGFRDADELRTRAAKARSEKSRRLLQKGVREEGLKGPQAAVRPTSPGSSSQQAKEDEAWRKAGLARDNRTLAQRVDRWARQRWASVKEELIDQFQTGVFDRLKPLKDAEGAIDPARSGYVSARLSTGASSVLYASMLYGSPQLVDGVIQKKPDSRGLLSILQPVGADLNRWAAWMVGKRADMLADQQRENNLNLEEIAYLKSLAGADEKTFEAVAKDVRGFMTDVLRLMQKAGLLMPEQVEAFNTDAYYLPFYRVDDEAIGGDRRFDPQSVVRPFTRRGLSHQDSGIKRLKGGALAINDPIENLFAHLSRSIDASMKNYALARAMPNIMRHLTTAKEGDRAKAIRVMWKGKPYWFNVDEPALLRALTAVGEKPRDNAALNIGRSMKVLLTTGVTLDPGFMMRNFMRDTLHSWLIDKNSMRFGIDSLKGAAATLSSIRASVTGRADDADPAVVSMMFAGASFVGGHIYGTDPAANAAAMRKALRRRGLSDRSADAYMRSMVTSAAQFTSLYLEIGEAIENANRVAVFKAAQAANASPVRAAYEAKDLMDYSLRGQWVLIQVMADVLPFFNARLQGLYKLGREARRDPKVLGLVATRIAARGALVAMAATALVAAYSGDDRYEELEEWDKDANWHFWVGGVHYRLPKPFELGIVFGTIPERMYRLAGQYDRWGESVQSLWHNIVTTLAINPIPQALRPLSEIYFNFDTFRQRPIESMSDENKLPGQRYSAHTSAVMAGIGSTLNVSPKKLQYAWDGYLGTLGSYFLGATDWMVRVARGDVMPVRHIEDYPIVGSFVRTGPAWNTEYQTELYDLMQEAEQTQRSVREMYDSGDEARGERLEEDKADLLAMRASLTLTTDRISKLRKERDAVMRDQDTTPADKRQQLDELQSEINDAARETMLEVDEALP